MLCQFNMPFFFFFPAIAITRNNKYFYVLKIASLGIVSVMGIISRPIVVSYGTELHP